MENFIYIWYQKLGDYFTGSQRKNPLIVVVIISFLLVSGLAYYFQVQISETTLNLVFSSITQALLSLVALLGVAALFKLEAIRGEENQIMQSALNSQVYSWLASRLEGKIIVTGEDLMLELNTIFKEGNPNEARIKVLKTKLEFLFLGRKLTREYLITFTIYTFFVVLVSLVFLIFAPFIAIHYLGVSSLLLVLLLTGYCLFLVTKGISDAIYH